MMSDRIFAATIGLVIVVLVAGFTHFVTILILPDIATQDAYRLLAGAADTHKMTILPSSRPGDADIPFRDPATIQGVCLFDLTNAPVRVRAVTQEGRLLTLSFRTADGRIFYSITDRAALHGKIDIRLLTDAQLGDVEADDIEDQGLPEELRLKAPGLKGLIVATTLVARPEQAAESEARIKAIICAPEPLRPPS